MRSTKSLKALLKKFSESKFLRFLIVGTVNTGATYVIYLLLLPFMSSTLSYSITYVVGILISFLLNSLFVFNTRMTVAKAAKYPSVYIVQYLIGLAIVYAWSLLNLRAEFAPLIAIIVTIPVSFLMNRVILKDTPAAPIQPQPESSVD